MILLEMRFSRIQRNRVGGGERSRGGRSLQSSALKRKHAAPINEREIRNYTVPIDRRSTDAGGQRRGFDRARDLLIQGVRKAPLLLTYRNHVDFNFAID